MMGSNNGRHGSRIRTWRAWCRQCEKHLAMNGNHSLWPDEIRCPLCETWCKVLAVASAHLKGDVICPTGSGRFRVED